MIPEDIIKQLDIQSESDFNGCEACRIEHKDLQVKQMPAHTCEKGKPSRDFETLRSPKPPTIPEQKMTYQERVDKENRLWINSKMTVGVRAVAAQAEAIIIREWGSLEKYNDWLKAGNPAALNTQKYLLENGYIEPKPKHI